MVERSQGSFPATGTRLVNTPGEKRLTVILYRTFDSPKLCFSNLRTISDGEREPEEDTEDLLSSTRQQMCERSGSSRPEFESRVRIRDSLRSLPFRSVNSASFRRKEVEAFLCRT